MNNNRGRGGGRGGRGGRGGINQPRRRRHEIAMRKYNRFQRRIGLTLIALSIPTAIAAIIIGETYTMQTSPCYGPIYIIAPKRYLCIVGIIQLVFGIFYAIGQCSKRKKWLNSLNGLTGCLLIYYIVWAIIGLIMYDNQFNDQCKQEIIAKMILSWCIINISLTGLVFIITCIVCMIPERPERDPLLAPV